MDIKLVLDVILFAVFIIGFVVNIFKFTGKGCTNSGIWAILFLVSLKTLN